jgi:MoxR-like ATPase
VEASVRDYIVRIARATRETRELELGASPRGTMALYQTCQAWAGIQGRDYVLPDDVKRLALPVLCHRMIVSPQAQLHGRSAREMIEDIISSVPVPVEG